MPTKQNSVVDEALHQQEGYLETHTHLLQEEEEDLYRIRGFSKQLTSKSKEIEQNMVLLSTVLGMELITELTDQKDIVTAPEVLHFKRVVCDFLKGAINSAP